MPEEKKSKSGINDTWIFLFLYPAISFFVVHIGNGNTFSESIKIPSYYTDLLIAFGCSFAFGFYFRKIVVWINLRFPEKDQIKNRLRLHLIYGIALPLGVIALVEAVYLYSIGFGINHPPFLRFDLPISLVFLVMINLIYLFLVEFSRADRDLVETTFSQSILVNQGKKKVKLSIDQIAYFFSDHGTSWAVIKTGEKYLLDESIQAIGAQVNPNLFFQLNRKILASKSVIKSYVQTPSRKLSVELAPAFSEEVFVSKLKSADFIAWYRV